jgi:competence protein ComFC
MNVIDCHERLHGLKIWFLYDYESTMRQRLFQFKGLYDFELRSIFLERMIDFIRWKYKNCVFVPAPSSVEDDQKRGFPHLCAMLDYFKIPYETLIQKQHHFKQANLSKEERNKVGQKLCIIDGHRLYQKRIVLFDDVFTTGSTLLAMQHLIKPFKPKSIEAFVLAKNPKNSFWN